MSSLCDMVTDSGPFCFLSRKHCVRAGDTGGPTALSADVTPCGISVLHPEAHALAAHKQGRMQKSQSGAKPRGYVI